MEWLPFFLNRLERITRLVDVSFSFLWLQWSGMKLLLVRWGNILDDLRDLVMDSGWNLPRNIHNYIVFAEQSPEYVAVWVNSPPSCFYRWNEAGRWCLHVAVCRLVRQTAQTAMSHCQGWDEGFPAASRFPGLFCLPAAFPILQRLLVVY